MKALAAIVLFLMIATALYARPQAQRELLLFDLGDQRLDEYWTQQQLQVSWAGTAIGKWTPKGQTLDNWKEMLNCQSFRIDLSDETAEDLMLRLKAERQEQCPTLVWKVLQQTATSIVYESRMIDRSGATDQHEIARIVDGKSTRFRLSYIAKAREMPEDQRKRWVGIMSAARVSFVID